MNDGQRDGGRAARSGIQVALLRGINVGTAKPVPMAELVSVFQDAGYGAVTTLLRSGNVVFESPDTPGEDRIAALVSALEGRTGTRAHMLVLSASELCEIDAANPLREVSDNDSRLVTTFLDIAVDASTIVAPPAESLLPEIVRVARRAVYQWSPLGVSASSLSTAWWRGFGPRATARNQRTIDRIIAEVDARA